MDNGNKFFKYGYLPTESQMPLAFHAESQEEVGFTMDGWETQEGKC